MVAFGMAALAAIHHRNTTGLGGIRKFQTINAATAALYESYAIRVTRFSTYGSMTVTNE
jgi:hypothetical protein